MRYFDSRDMPLDVRHVMASGALPPAFPAVRIDGELYWDGGILSNTPVEVVFDDKPRRDAAGLRRPHVAPARARAGDDLAGDEPPEGHPVRQPRGQPHRAPEADPPAAARDRASWRRACREEMRDDPRSRELASYGCLHPHARGAPAGARACDDEDHTKDIDFSADGIGARWQAGYDYVRRVIAREPWQCEVDALSGVLIHEMSESAMESEHV